MTARYIYRAQREPVLANKSHCCNTVGIPAGRPVSTYLENSSHSKNLSVACTFYVEKILQGWSEEADGQKKNSMTHAAFPSSSIITGFLGHKMSKSPEKRWPYYCYSDHSARHSRQKCQTEVCETFCIGFVHCLNH